MSWDVFICHATEDKHFVRPLADKLRAAGLRVWYDEFALRLGDSLRRSIDKGLKNSRFGIVVLSGSFFRKPWPQRELDGLVARELEGRSQILPIWHDVSLAEVAEHSPPLADRLAAQSSDNLDEIVRSILEVVGERPYLKAETGSFPRYMIKEIHDQPQMLEDNIRRWKIQAEHTNTNVRKLVSGTRAVTITGSGSSFHAAQLGAWWLQELARLNAAAVPASELASQEGFLRDNLLVCVSHSGDTPDVLELAARAKLAGSPVIAVCGRPDSELPKLCNYTCHTNVGPEMSVPVTKSFSGQLLSLLILASSIRHSMPVNLKSIVENISLIPELVQNAINLDENVRALAGMLLRYSSVLLSARGSFLPIAYNAALRFKKVTKLPITAYPAGEFKHGPLAIVDQETTVLALLTDDEAGLRTARDARQILAMGGVVHPLLFHSGTPTELKEWQYGLDVEVRGLPHLLMPFVAEVLLQLVAYYLGTARGVDVDAPRHLLEIAMRKRGKRGMVI